MGLLLTRISKFRGLRPVCICALALVLAVAPEPACDSRVGDAVSGPELDVRVGGLDCSGDLYVYVITAEHMDTPGTGVAERVVQVETGSAPVALRFAGLAPGAYAVRTFLDTNGNGRLDRGLFGPKEPWALSWRQGAPRSMPPQFMDISFDLREDRGIELELE